MAQLRQVRASVLRAMKKNPKPEGVPMNLTCVRRAFLVAGLVRAGLERYGPDEVVRFARGVGGTKAPPYVRVFSILLHHFFL